MARGDISFEGIGARYTTYKAHVSIDADNVGDAVTLVANKTAGLGSSGDPLLGKVILYEDDGYVTVQDGGYMELDGVSGSLPSYKNGVVVNGSGCVIAVTSAHILAGTYKSNVVVDTSSTTYKVVVLV